jgi:cytochrome c-type biogenesis protein CcmH
MISRRGWLRAVGYTAGIGALARVARAQDPQAPAGIADTSNLFAMDQSAARTVRLPPKPGAAPSMQPAERDALEHRIRCQCGCTLDVYTCRTTDFSCQVSPAMHRDVMALVQGGYDEKEIIAAFVNVYGDRALMAPPKSGFNLLAYVMPGIAIAIGAIVLAVVIKRWQRPAASVAARPGNLPGIDASPDELARLEAAVRDDS